MLSELQQRILQVCENSWIKRVASVTRVETRGMKDHREEIGTNGLYGWQNSKQPDELGWIHSQNEMSREETWRLWETRKTTAKMGGLCEERSKESIGGRTVERKGQ